jgi:hypothetical protein
MGTAISSSLLVGTGTFQSVFFTTAIVMLVSVIFAAFAIKPDDRTKPSGHPHATFVHS